MILIVIEPSLFNIGVEPPRLPIRLLREGQNHYVALIAAARYNLPIQTVDTPRARDATQQLTPVTHQLPRGATPMQPMQPQVPYVAQLGSFSRP